MRSLLGYLWALPNSLLGLIFAGLGWLTGAKLRGYEGVLQAWGGCLSWLLARTPVRAAAITLGHVVLARDEDCMVQCWDHELGHVRQCEIWGPLFLLAYGSASLLAWVQGRHYYKDNWFEHDAEAFRAARQASR